LSLQLSDRDSGAVLLAGLTGALDRHGVNRVSGDRAARPGRDEFDARRQNLDGQTTLVPPEVLAPVLKAFFAG
jgi:hypothetical protein